MKNKPPKSGSVDGPTERNAEAYLNDDILQSRATPELSLLDGAGVPEEVAEQLVRDVDEFLSEHEVYSKNELKLILQKLENAIFINNHPKAKEIRKHLMQRYGDDVLE